MTGALEALADLSRDLAAMSRAVTTREDELRKLLDLMQTVERGVMPEDVLGNIFESFSGVIPFERIGCAFLTEDGKRVVAYWAKSELGPAQIKKGYSRLLEGSSLEAILATGQPRIINDLEEYLAGKPQSEATRRIIAEGGRSSLTCPLVLDGRPIGFLFFTSRQKNAYEDSHKYIFLQIASQVAASIQRSRLYQKLMERNRPSCKKSQQLQVVAAHDALTGILNRGAIDEVLGARSPSTCNPVKPTASSWRISITSSRSTISWATVRAIWSCANAPAGCHRRSVNPMRSAGTEEKSSCL